MSDDRLTFIASKLGRMTGRIIVILFDKWFFYFVAALMCILLTKLVFGPC